MSAANNISQLDTCADGECNEMNAPPRKKRKLSMDVASGAKNGFVQGLDHENKIMDNGGQATKAVSLSQHCKIATRKYKKILDCNSIKCDKKLELICKVVKGLMILADDQLIAAKNESEAIENNRKCLNTCQEIVENCIIFQSKNENQNYDLYLMLSYIYLSNGQILKGIEFCNLILIDRETKGWVCDYETNKDSSKENLKIKEKKRRLVQPTLKQMFGSKWKLRIRRLERAPNKIVVKRGISKEVCVQMARNENKHNNEKHDKNSEHEKEENNENNENSNKNDDAKDSECTFMKSLSCLENLPIKIEISLRCNLGLMCLRCARYTDAMFEIDTIAQLKQENMNGEMNNYDPFPDYIKAVILYNQTHCQECATLIETIFEKMETSDTINSNDNRMNDCNGICLDKYAKFELYCILADCYCKTQEFDKAKLIFCQKLVGNEINDTMNEKNLISCNNLFFWQIYINFLQSIGNITLAYQQCVKLILKDDKYRFNGIFQTMLNELTVYKNNSLFDNCGVSTVIDAQYAGNQCRFVNDGDSPNCEFLVRNEIEPSTYPIESQVWLKTSTKEKCLLNYKNYLNNEKYKDSNDSFGKEGIKLCAKKEWLKYKKEHSNFAILKGEELCVSYGNEYWHNLKNSKKKLLSVKERNNNPWHNIIFTHLIVDCCNLKDLYNPNAQHNNIINLKNKINISHLNNPRLCDKNYPNCIEIKHDNYGGFGCFATKNIKHERYLLRYAGIKRFATHDDLSQSRYAITLATYDNITHSKQIAK